MVLVVETVARLLLHEVQHVRDSREYFTLGEHVGVFCWKVELILCQTEHLGELCDFVTKLAVDLVATNAAEVVTTVFEECTFEVHAC